MRDLPTPIELRGMRQLAWSDVAGTGNIGEGLGLHVRRGRRILYAAHVAAPLAFSAIDVTDPRAPVVIQQVRLPHKDVRANSLSIMGDVMAIAYQPAMAGAKPAGFELYDLASGDTPQLISFFDASGPHSRGAHFVNIVGNIVYAACGAPDWQPARPKDHQFVRMIDIGNPSKPTELGRWWVPGQRHGDDVRLEYHEQRITPHNINVYPERPDRAYIGYCDAGVIILDIGDLSAPKLVGQYDYHPPMKYGFTHTVMPLFDRGLLIVADEASDPRGLEQQGPEGWTDGAGFDHPKPIWVMDGRYERTIVPLSTLPMPPREEFKFRGGNFGAHNIHENDPTPTAFKSDRLVFGTYFNAGLRVYDTINPLRPEEVASFIPPAPPRSRLGAAQMNDVYVDEQRIIYATDRTTGGLYILELTN